MNVGFIGGLSNGKAVIQQRTLLRFLRNIALNYNLNQTHIIAIDKDEFDVTKKL